MACVDPGGLVGDRAARDEVPQVVREEHRPLRVAARERQERVERVSHVSPREAEALVEEDGRRAGRERQELDRDRVLEQWPRGILEQALHQRRGGARERVRRYRGLVLEHATEDPVRAVHAQEVLELVERDQAADTGSLVQLRGQVEEAEEDALDVDARVRLQRGREPARAEGEADLPRTEEPVDRAADRAPELAVVGPLDADDHARQGEHALEVDECRRPPRVRGVSEDAAEEARLPVPPRCDEPRRMPADGEREEPRRLLLPVDHLAGEELARDAKRVRVRFGHRPSLHDRGSFVYLK